MAMERTRTRSRAKRLGLVAGGIILVLLLIRLALTPVVQWYVNRKLDQLEGFDGRVSAVGISFLRGAYSIEGVVIEKTVEDKPPLPFIKVDRADLSLEWKALAKGRLVGEIGMDRLQVNLVRGATDEGSQVRLDQDWVQVVEDLFPFRINRFTIRDGELHFRDLKAEPKVEVGLTNFYVVAENLGNIGNGREKPADILAEGKTVGQGEVKLHVKLDPFQEAPTFSLAASVTNLDLPALNMVLKPYTKVDVKKGTFSAFSEFEAAGGQYEGYIKPLFTDLDIVDLEQDAKNPVNLVWQAIVAGVMHLFKNKPEDQTATRIPVSGTFDQPDVAIWESVGQLLRNAFVEALKPRIDDAGNLPQASEEAVREKAK